jgi:hypothetical protein
MAKARLNAQELLRIQEHAISLIKTDPEMKELIFRLLSEVTQKREITIEQFMSDILHQED